MAEIVDKALALIPGRRGRKRKRSTAISAKRAQIATVRKNLAKLAADVAKLAKIVGSDIRNVAKPAKPAANKRTAARTGKRRTAVKRVSAKKP